MSEELDENIEEYDSSEENMLAEEKKLSKETREWCDKWFSIVGEGIDEYSIKLYSACKIVNLCQEKINGLVSNYTDPTIRSYLLYSTYCDKETISDDEIMLHKIDLIYIIKGNMKPYKKKRDVYKDIRSKLTNLESKVCDVYMSRSEEFDVNKELQEILALDVY